MSNPAVDSQELDFEDVIAQFERNLKGSRKEGNSAENLSSEDSMEDGYNIIMDMAEFEPDLQVLCEALMERIQFKGRGSKKFGFRNNEGTARGHRDSGFITEVFRSEIKTTLARMQDLGKRDLEESELLSSSERSTINSMKRQVRERDEELKTIKKKLKEAQIVRYRLEHSVAGYQATCEEYENANELLEKEVGGLRKQNEALTKRCKYANEQYKKDHHERERLHLTISKFRQEVVAAHQNALNSRTETKQAKRRLEHLEARAAETKASWATVSTRIRELKEIQDHMVATMRGIQESGENTAARQVLKSLGDQRSRLVGKIANLLTRKKQDDNVQQNNRPTLTLNVSENSGENTNPSNSPDHTSHSPPPRSNSPNYYNADDFSRKQRFGTFRKFGNELTRRTTGRNGRRIVRENVERTCEAVERDTEALREVIELKENELDRMEGQLTEAIERMSALEIALQMERQRKKLEKRNMQNLALEQAQAELRSFTTTRWKKTTLFDWQSQPAKTAGKGGKCGVLPRTSAEVSKVDAEL